MIGKITKQELHPSLLLEIQNMKSGSFVISVEEPEEVFDGLMWFSPKTEIAQIWYKGRWYLLCSNTCGPVDPGEPDDKAKIKIEIQEVILSDIIEPGIIPLPFEYNPTSETLNIYANGILIGEGEVKIENDCLVKIDDYKKIPTWNENPEDKTHFMFVKMDKNVKPEDLVSFELENVTFTKEKTNNSKFSIPIPPKAKENIKNMHVLLNNVLINEGTGEGEYIITSDSITGFWGEIDVESELHFKFISYSYSTDKESSLIPQFNSGVYFSQDGEIKPGFTIKDGSYSEVMANGLTIYPSEYIIKKDSITLKNGRWDEGTEVYVRNLSNVNVEIEENSIIEMDKGSIKEDLEDMKSRSVSRARPIAMRSAAPMPMNTMSTFNNQRKIDMLEKIFNPDLAIDAVIKDSIEVERLTKNSELTKSMAKMYLENPSTLNDYRGNFSFLFNRIDEDFDNKSIASINRAYGKVKSISDGYLNLSNTNNRSFIPNSIVTITNGEEVFEEKILYNSLSAIKVSEKTTEKILELGPTYFEIYESSMKYHIDGFMPIANESISKQVINLSLRSNIHKSMSLWIDAENTIEDLEVFVNGIECRLFETKSFNQKSSHNFVQIFNKSLIKPIIQIRFRADQNKPLEDQIDSILGYIQ